VLGPSFRRGKLTRAAPYYPQDRSPPVGASSGGTMKRLLVASALIAWTLSACDLPKGQPGEGGDGKKDEAGEEAASVGPFADAKLTDFEARAKKAGWKVVTSSSEDTEGTTLMALELEDSSHFAYVTVVDLAGVKSAAAKVDKGAAVVLQADPESKDKPAALLDQLLAKAPLDKLDREALGKGLGELGYKVGSTSSDSEDGLTTSVLTATKGGDEDGSEIDVTLYDYREALKEGRIAVDKQRIMNVFVCEDCTKRNTKILSQAWQNAKAKVLLGKLTN
jgi:hypothetical protein